MVLTEMFVSLMPRGVVLKPDSVILGSNGAYHGISDPMAKSRVSKTSKPASIRDLRTWEGGR